MDIILIPYCNGSHWTLLVVNVTLKRLEYYDSLGGGCNPNLVEGTMVVLSSWRAASNIPLETGNWPTLDMYHLGVAPHQRNYCDCGIFVMRVAEHLVRGASLLDISQSEMSWLRKLTVLELKEGTF